MKYIIYKVSDIFIENIYPSEKYKSNENKNNIKQIEFS